MFIIYSSLNKIDKKLYLLQNSFAYFGEILEQFYHQLIIFEIW